MGNIVPIKGAHMAPKSDQSRMETLIITPAIVLDCLERASGRHNTATTVRSRFWNNAWGLIARRQLTVIGKRKIRGRSRP